MPSGKELKFSLQGCWAASKQFHMMGLLGEDLGSWTDTWSPNKSLSRHFKLLLMDQPNQ